MFKFIILKLKLYSVSEGLPGGSVVKTSACQCRRCKRCGFSLWVRRKEEEMATHSIILAGRIPWTEESGVLGHRGHIVRHS